MRLVQRTLQDSRLGEVCAKYGRLHELVGRRVVQEHGLCLHVQHSKMRYSSNRAYVGCRGSRSESTRAGSWGRVSIVIGHSPSFPIIEILVPRFSTSFRSSWWPRGARVVSCALLMPRGTSSSCGRNGGSRGRCGG